MRTRLGLFLLTILALPGCSAFSISDGVASHRATRVTADVPAGWFVESLDPTLVISRNGPRLQRISISATPLDAELSGTQRQYHVGMLPNEVAELALGLIEATPGHANFATRAIEFDEIAGQDGFRADAIFVDQGRLPKRIRLHGVMLAEYVFQFAYEAATSIYYDLDEAAFEELAQSIRIESD